MKDKEETRKLGQGRKRNSEKVKRTMAFFVFTEAGRKEGGKEGRREGPVAQCANCGRASLILLQHRL
jgi:hypothetical protein